MLKIEIAKYPLSNSYKFQITNDQGRMARDEVDFEYLMKEIDAAVRRMKP